MRLFVVPLATPKLSGLRRQAFSISTMSWVTSARCQCANVPEKLNGQISNATALVFYGCNNQAGAMRML